MEHAALRIDGEELEVVSLRGEEAASAHFRYALTCPCGDRCPEPDALLGRSATITLRDVHGGRRTVIGILAEAATEVSGELGGTSLAASLGVPVLTIVVRPAAFRLTLGRDSRVFHDQDVVEIVTSVLGRGAVPHRWELTRDYPKRTYTAQYREDDWSFVERLLAEEGIDVWFDHEEGSLLVLGDASGSAAELAGGGSLPFIPASGLQAARDSVYALGDAVGATCDGIRLKAFDPARPAFAVRAEAGGAPRGSVALHVYDAPMGGPDDAEVVAARAEVLNEVAAARRAGMSGRSTCARIVPGRVLRISGHPAARGDGRLFVTRCTVAIEQRRRDTAAKESTSMDVAFEALPASVAFRPTPPCAPAGVASTDDVLRHRAYGETRVRSGPHGAVGLQSGVVVGPAGAEVYPDEGGRVRVQHHWDREGQRDEASGKWMRVAQRGTAGSMLLPRTGWNVMSLHEEGAANAPMVQARVVDAEHPPPYGLPANKTRTSYKTATVPGGGSFNELRYESQSGAEEMFVHASRDLGVLANNVKTEAISGNSTRTVGNDCALTVGATALETVGKDQTITIGRDEKQKVGAARSVEVGGSQTKLIAGGRHLRVGGAAQTSVVGAREVAVGAAQLDVSLGSLKASSKTMKILVGGAVVKVTPRGITEAIGTTVGLKDIAGKLGGVAGTAAGLVGGPTAAVGLSVQVVGGAKFEHGALNRTIVSGKGMTETVGGAMRFVTTEFADGTQGSYSLTVGAALEGHAPEVTIQATESIALHCGASKIVVSKLGITISAPNVDLSGATAIKAAGANIFHV